ncbi:hypothetical protein E4T47_01520 [Aureobasidium subglaciale]|nr:hypothetical protein E4T47_01520 [Aureobasidium subglaciale]
MAKCRNINKADTALFKATKLVEKRARKAAREAKMSKEEKRSRDNTESAERAWAEAKRVKKKERKAHAQTTNHPDPQKKMTEEQKTASLHLGLSQKISDLTNQNQSLRSINERLSKLHVESESQKSIQSGLDVEVDNLREEIDAAMADNNQLRASNAALYTNAEQWETYATDKETRIEQLNDYADTLEGRIGTKKTKLIKLRERLEHRKNVIKDLQESNDNLEERLATKKIKSQAFKVEYKAVKRSLDECINGLDDQLDEDQSVVMELLRRNVNLKKPVEVREQQLIKAQYEQVSRHEQIVSELYSEINDLRDEMERMKRGSSHDSMYKLPGVRIKYEDDSMDAGT